MRNSDPALFSIFNLDGFSLVLTIKSWSLNLEKMGQPFSLVPSLGVCVIVTDLAESSPNIILGFEY